MNNLFGKGREKILEFFYLNKLNEPYFNEILRDTGLTPNTTLKHLAVLKELNLIVSKKKVANTFYKLNRDNPATYSILSYFDFKKFNSLPLARKNAILSFMKEIKTKPLIVVLFGSTANETFSSESDIDLLLVYNKKELKNVELSDNIRAIFGFEIQTFIIDLNYFEEQLLKNDDKVVSHAIKTGYPVKGFEEFYKKVLR